MFKGGGSIYKGYFHGWLRLKGKGKISNTKIPLNTILIIFVSVLLMSFFLADKNGTYLQGSEAQVYLLFGVALLSLFINAQFNNEFLEILNVVFIGFYIFRIPFLFYEGLTSDVLSRNVDVSDIPWYIIVLAVQYVFLVLCIIVVNPRVPRTNLSGYITEPIFKRMLLFSFFIIAANFFIHAFWFSIHGGVFSSFLAILKTIFTVDNALMLVLVSSLMIEQKVLRKYKFAVIFCVLLFVAIYTYGGSKAGLLQAILLTYLAILVIRGPLIFRLSGLAATVMLGLGAFFLFFVAKVFRVFHVNSQYELSYNQFIFFMQRFYVEQIDMYDLLNVFSYRIGYLDFFIQKVSNPVYEPYVSFTYYLKALIDKVTPGFDVFGVPFASRAIYSAYNGPSVGVLNSELITVFGEGYLLLGFFSFMLYLAILLFIKYAFSRFRSFSSASYGVFYMYIIFSFYWWLTGSGLDMLIALMIYQGIFVFFTMGLIGFWSRKERPDTLTNFPFLSKVIMAVQRRDNA